MLRATADKRANWTIAGAGFGIHWPDIDEDPSTGGLLRGARAPGDLRGGVGESCQGAPAVAVYERLGTREEVLHFDIPVPPA